MSCLRMLSMRLKALECMTAYTMTTLTLHIHRLGVLCEAIMNEASLTLLVSI